MSHLFAILFDRPDAADQALPDLRAMDLGDHLELEDACLAEVPATEQGLIIKRAITPASGPVHGLTANFWHHLIGHLWAHAHDTTRVGQTPGVGLDAAEVRELTSYLKPGSSAVFALIRRFDAEPTRQALNPVLQKHRGRLIRIDFGAREIDKIHALMDPVVGDPPTADELATEASAEQEAEAAARKRSRELAQARAMEHEKLLREAPLTAEVVRGIVQRCRDAARRGEEHTLAYQFPSTLMRDHGRTINVGDERWPEYLEGQPREVYGYFKRVLEPRGYTITPRVLDYPGGVIGDLGFMFGWGHR